MTLVTVAYARERAGCTVQSCKELTNTSESLFIFIDLVDDSTRAFAESIPFCFDEPKHHRRGGDSINLGRY